VAPEPAWKQNPVPIATTYAGEPVRYWPAEPIVATPDTRLAVGGGMRFIETVKLEPDHGHKIPREMFTSRGRIALQARDTRTVDNPKGAYRTGKDLQRTYWEGPSSSFGGGGCPVRGPFNPTGYCSLPGEQRLAAAYPSYSTQLPLDQDVIGARVYYGTPGMKGLGNSFYEGSYGRGVATLDNMHHRNTGSAYAPGMLESQMHSRMQVLQAADKKIGYLNAIGAEPYLRRPGLTDDRYVNRSMPGMAAPSMSHRHMNPQDFRFHEAQRARAGQSLMSSVTVSPRSFI